MNQLVNACNFPEKRVKNLGGVHIFLLMAMTMAPPAHPTTSPPPQVNPPIPLPPASGSLLHQQPQIPEVSDGPFQVWNEKDKYFLVITVGQSGVERTNLDFAHVDGWEVADSFANLGYKPLLGKTRNLTGEQTNRGNVISALEALKDLVPPAIVIVFYSGHGITDDQDHNLWLQLSGQDTVAPGHGITLSEIVEIPRKVGYNGDLVVILDSGYSGPTPLPDTLELQDLGEKTILYSSNSTIQNSQTLRLLEGKKSAFTHTLLQALGSQWSTADENQDGILGFSELHNFIRIRLHRYFQNKEIPELMEPKLIGPDPKKFFIAYQRDRVQQWLSEDRQELQVLALERALSPSISREKILTKTASPTLEVSKHAKALAEQISSNPNDLYAKGLLALTEGNLNEARTLITRAESKGDANKPKLAKIYLSRGRTETYAGQFKRAISWYKKFLAIQPPVEPKLLNEFGLVWAKAGLYEEALPFLEQGLKLGEKTLDPLDPSLAVSLNNLAGLYHNQGKYVEAEPLYKRAMQITDSALGPEHPSIVPQLNNLAGLYREQGKYAEAVPLYLRALRITESSLGPEHPKVAPALNRLALVYGAQGKYAEAEPLYLRVVRIDEATLGAIHPRVAFDLNNLAITLRAQGKYAEAVPLYLRMVRIDEAAFGNTHPEVAIDLNNLAELYRIQGKYTEAQALYQRSYDIMRRSFGLGHLKTRTVLNNYVRMLTLSGQNDKARMVIEEYQEAIGAFEAPHRVLPHRKKSHTHDQSDVPATRCSSHDWMRILSWPRVGQNNHTWRKECIQRFSLLRWQTLNFY